MGKDLLNILEAMEYTGVTDSRILYKAIRFGKINIEKLGPFKYKLPISELEKYVNNKIDMS